jgi:16S rRNA (cytosine1402-N4)-methyltransferase
MDRKPSHQPVLYHEIIHVLRPQQDKKYIDGTVGAGGHAKGILDASNPTGMLLGFDLDPQALDLAQENLAQFGSRAILVHANYESLRKQLDRLNWKHVDGILLDLGMSSIQLDSAGRGFSFQTTGPLDMRFDPDQVINAGNLVNELPEMELSELLFKYGEERRSRQLAQAIVKARPLHTTRELAEVIARVTSGGRKGLHPATRSFQALRIAVNRELESLESFLPQAVDSLVERGVLAIISFHSLEDRLVKQFFQRESKDCICPPRQPICTCGHRASIRVITKKPVRPQESEVQQNPRARSARLRVAEKLTSNR